MITAGDFLAGGGGVTEAMVQNGLDVKWVLNHDKIAIRTNMFNHNGIKHYWSDIYKQDEHEMEPLGSLTTIQKNQFISAFIDKKDPDLFQNCFENFDFDIKMRFLDPEELSQISTFPKGYFTHPLLKLTKKEQTKLIGNAVPVEWARLIIEPIMNELSSILAIRKIAI